MSSPKQYFTSIDGLRLLASINIVLFHLVQIGGLYDLRGSPAWLFRILKGPAFHASLFFILAGFIYTVKYAPLADTFSTRALVKGRIRDLFPLHALTALAMLPFVIIPCIGAACLNIPKILFTSAIHLSMTWSIFPFFTYNLNTPSWALSAFFLCYFLFGPMLRRVVLITNRRAIVALMGACLVPGILWSFLYAGLGREQLYTVFHIFAPVRSFEFILGMLLARLFHLNNVKPRAVKVRDIPFLNDGIILSAFALVYLTLIWRAGAGMLGRWMFYHVVLLPLYALLLYRLARGDGWIARAFAWKPVNQLGKAGFYPYLVHIPLISWTCWTAEHAFGYKKLLHSPVNVLLLMVVLYGGSWLYWRGARKRKRSTYRGHDKNA
ncbi:MAG: acyltransferase family protein [Chitinivibrionales bacterium]|nr:acyltransferase family protein [Chitinivibrionales bacterium]MBD3395623.1 acyltransferase family protein [Chitinivibrionales bacterium]